ncbi:MULTISPECIES: hypothetical protein [unclassified Agromyces]|uniref:hypothetical protein n=1 Tax=unclassified Agromyces TaxID=2639701 RepID=UPI003015105B
MSTTRGDAGDSSAGAASTADRGLGVIILRPRPTLARSIGLPVLALALPLFVTVVWVLRPLGPTGLAATAAGAAVFLGLAGLAWHRYRRTRIQVSRQGLVERGFFGRMQRVPHDEVAGVLRIDTYRGDTLETVHQLFVVDPAGRCLVRMRGTFWDDAAMDAVAPTLGVEQTVRYEPVTLAELRASDPRLLYWFEGRGLPRP